MNRIFMILSMLLTVSCGVSEKERQEIVVETQAKVSLDIDTLQNRLSKVEFEMAKLNEVQKTQTAAAPKVEAPARDIEGTAPRKAWDQQEYERQVQALCDRRGIDCS